MTSYDLKRLLKIIVKDCRPGVRIVALYGIHGASDGKLGDQDGNLISCFELAMNQVKADKIFKQIIYEKKISIY